VFPFRLSEFRYSWYVLFKRAINFGSVFPNCLDRRIYETPTHVRFSFHFFLRVFNFCNHGNFFFDAHTILFVNVAMSSRYQSPVNCRSRKVEGNFMHKVNYRYHCHLPDLEFTIYTYRHLLELDGLPFQGHGSGWILRIAYFLENYIDIDTGNVVISEVEDLCLSY
jgi:hypothetical protein